jgi:hypothetical protein
MRRVGDTFGDPQVQLLALFEGHRLVEVLLHEVVREVVRARLLRAADDLLLLQRAQVLR